MIDKPNKEIEMKKLLAELASKTKNISDKDRDKSGFPFTDCNQWYIKSDVEDACNENDQ